MQYLIALSTAETDYIGLSTTLQKVIGIINLLEELKGNGFNVHTNTPKVTCRKFEDKEAACQWPQTTATDLEQNTWLCDCIVFALM